MDITTVSQSVHRLLAHMRKDALASQSPLVNCIVNDALVHAVPNVQQMLLSLFMIFNCLNASHYETIKLVNSKFVYGIIFQ